MSYIVEIVTKFPIELYSQLKFFIKIWNFNFSLFFCKILMITPYRNFDRFSQKRCYPLPKMQKFVKKCIFENQQESVRDGKPYLLSI